MHLPCGNLHSGTGDIGDYSEVTGSSKSAKQKCKTTPEKEDEGPMAEHKQGTMDITVQEKTYAGFISFVARSCVALILFTVFLAVFAI